MDLVETKEAEPLEAQMSFLEHLDELRRRLVRSVLFIGLAFMFCWNFSDKIYSFLADPVQRELAFARQTKVEGGETFSSFKVDESAQFVFDSKTNLGSVVVPIGTTVRSKISQCGDNKLCV